MLSNNILSCSNQDQEDVFKLPYRNLSTVLSDGVTLLLRISHWFPQCYTLTCTVYKYTSLPLLRTSLVKERIDICTVITRVIFVLTE
jgi:hypothetical protein